MKKIYSVALVFATLWGYSQIQSEDFEGATTPTGWQVAINTGTVAWEFGKSTYASFPSSFAGNAATFDDDLYGELVNDCDLISPGVNLMSYPNVYLAFDYSLQDFAGSGDLDVLVWDGTAWVLIFNQTNDTTFETKQFDVTAYKNAAFKVKFKYRDDDWGWGAGVDSFRLSATPLATSENTTTKISIGPNPAHDNLTITTSGKVSNIMIYNMTGSKVALNSNTGKVVDISKLTPGMYIISVDIDGKNYTKKFLKK